MIKSSNEISGNAYVDTSEHDSIDIFDFYKIIKSQKWIIITFIAISTIASITIALMLPRYYEVSATIVPNLSSYGSNNQRISSIAALAGVSGQETAISEKEVALLILKSREFKLEFIDKYEIDNVLYQETVIPIPAKVNEDFSNLITINESLISNDIKISLIWKDSEIAKKWLTLMLVEINALMKERALSKGEKSLLYLNEQMKNTKEADLRANLITMIKQETQKLMLANIREEYLFETIDPPIIPAYPSKPNRKLIVILSIIAGFVLGVFAAMLRVASINK